MNLEPLTHRTWTSSLLYATTRPARSALIGQAIPFPAHWGFEDPAAAIGTDEEKRAVFHKVFRQIMTRMNVFVSLPLHMLEKNAIQHEIKAIGQSAV